MPPPSFKGKVKKLKDRPEQALSNLQINPNYVAAVTQNAQNQLDNIVKIKPTQIIFLRLLSNAIRHHF